MSEDAIKYIVLVVEGPSDKTCLENGLRQYINSIKLNRGFEVDVVHGDRLVKDKDGSSLTLANCEESVSEEVCKCIHKLSLTGADVHAIAMLSDLDACFADRSFFIDDSACKKATYDNVLGVCKHQNSNRLARMRQGKYYIVKQMWNKSHVSVDGFLIPYRLFYMNVDLEWVVHDMLNCTKLEKEALAEQFDNDYGGDAKKFEAKINSFPSVSTDYNESWKPVIERQLRPFDKYTNIVCLLQWLKSLAK